MFCILRGKNLKSKRETRKIGKPAKLFMQEEKRKEKKD
jgi:hypothetical protein